MINEMKKECLVLDIETCSEYSIKKDFEKYVKYAKTKWFGCYSYKNNKYYNIEVTSENIPLIRNIINAHKTLVSFNGIEFDIPILQNNNLISGYYKQVDCMVVLGTDKFKHKNRGMLMGYKFKSNSLRNMAKTMGLTIQKGDIDYTIFEKDSWSDEEKTEIIKYLQADVEVTKQMFDKLFSFWSPFSKFISDKNVKNWSWLNSKIAPLVYKSACKIANFSEDYGQKGEKTEVGGRVITPRVDNATNVWYVDVTSLYPHLYIMFNLVDEVDKNTPNAWHGNEVFKVNGYYNQSKRHILTDDMQYKLKERIRLKAIDKNNPLVYAYKIYLNTFYGITRSKIFKNTYKENAGSDCCLLGQQVNHIMEDKMTEMGYKTLSGDTDSIFVQHSETKTKEQVKSDLKKVISYILKYVPFPSETFNIDIEHFIHYIMWIPDDKGVFKKKNYAYIYSDKNNNKKIEIMGLPIKKTNATELGPYIFEKYIKTRMIKENTGKFDNSWIKDIINKEVKENMEKMAIEYKASPYNTYSIAGKKSLYGQISKQYLSEVGGKIKLIKNNKFGKVGGAFKYCSLEEAKRYKLNVNDLDLKKLYNELQPFMKNNKSGFFKNNKGKKILSFKAVGFF